LGQERGVPLGDLAWTDDAPGIRAREAELEGTRWAVVEYSQGASREDWCEEGTEDTWMPAQSSTNSMTAAHR
jgi:hypothetical protein